VVFKRCARAAGPRSRSVAVDRAARPPTVGDESTAPPRHGQRKPPGIGRGLRARFGVRLDKGRDSRPVPRHESGGRSRVEREAGKPKERPRPHGHSRIDVMHLHQPLAGLSWSPRARPGFAGEPWGCGRRCARRARRSSTTTRRRRDAGARHARIGSAGGLPRRAGSRPRLNQGTPEAGWRRTRGPSSCPSTPPPPHMLRPAHEKPPPRRGQ
jgi:hypothetical protein